VAPNKKTSFNRLHKTQPTLESFVSTRFFFLPNHTLLHQSQKNVAWVLFKPFGLVKNEQEEGKNARRVAHIHEIDRKCFEFPLLFRYSDGRRARKNGDSCSACTFHVLACCVCYFKLSLNQGSALLFLPLLVIKAIKIVGSLYAV
jgi:hypothetical protein